MFGRIKVIAPVARRLIGLIALPCRETSFLTYVYELTKFDRRVFAAETEVGEAPDERVISYADQIEELMQIHLCHIQEVQIAGEDRPWNSCRSAGLWLKAMPCSQDDCATLA
jgi:hypothetical protein